MNLSKENCKYHNDCIGDPCALGINICDNPKHSISALKEQCTCGEYLSKEEIKMNDQLEIAGRFCLLQPCEIREDEASGRCYGCKIGSSIKNAYDHSTAYLEGSLVEPMSKAKLRRDIEIIMNICYPQGDWKDNKYVERISWRTCVEQIIDTLSGSLPQQEVGVEEIEHTINMFVKNTTGMFDLNKQKELAQDIHQRIYGGKE